MSEFRHILFFQNWLAKLITFSHVSDVNQVTLLGRVGAEPRKIGTGEAVAFPLFTESSVRLKDGTSKLLFLFVAPFYISMKSFEQFFTFVTAKTYSCWHKVLFVKKSLGDVVFNNVDRGQRVFISGRVAYKAPEANEAGRVVHSHQAAIIAEQVIFLEKSRKTSEESREGEEKESLAA